MVSQNLWKSKYIAWPERRFAENHGLSNNIFYVNKRFLKQMSIYQIKKLNKFMLFWGECCIL